MATILFYGRLSDLAEPITTSLPSHVLDTESLAVWLGEKHEGLRDALKMEGIRVILNQSFVSTPAKISDDDEIAFVSPLSGG